MHAGLFGTFCNFKRERQNDLFPFEKQNVPNKPACTFIWHIRVCMYICNRGDAILRHGGLHTDLNHSENVKDGF